MHNALCYVFAKTFCMFPEKHAYIKNSLRADLDLIENANCKMYVIALTTCRRTRRYPPSLFIKVVNVHLGLLMLNVITPLSASITFLINKPKITKKKNSVVDCRRHSIV